MDYYRKTVAQGACRIWTGAKDAAGYGRTTFRGRHMTVHRAVWFQAGYEVPAGFELDHICRQRACIALEHLRAVTHRENMLNRRVHANHSVCKWGHGDKVLSPRGRMVCYKCVAAAVKRWRANHPRVSKPPPHKAALAESAAARRAARLAKRSAA